MGREIRRVPPGWEHPTIDRDLRGAGNYQPMFDQTFEAAAAEWKAGFAFHEPDEHNGDEYWEWAGGPPNRAYYRPWSDDEATWYQVWETVSEGTPVTPPFATKGELREYLLANGEDRGVNSARDYMTGRIVKERLPTPEQVDFFLDSEWLPTGVTVPNHYGSQFRSGYAVADALRAKS